MSLRTKTIPKEVSVMPERGLAVKYFWQKRYKKTRMAVWLILTALLYDKKLHTTNLSGSFL